MRRPTLSVAPERPKGERWCVHLFDWNQQVEPPDVPRVLEGFPTAFDAWAFCVAHGLPDPVGELGDRARQSTLRPPEPDTTLRQGRLL